MDKWLQEVTQKQCNGIKIKYFVVCRGRAALPGSGYLKNDADNSRVSRTKSFKTSIKLLRVYHSFRVIKFATPVFKEA